ncbi:MAG: glutaredoxin domain-containing protein, partial [Pseudobdellovibrionaceae bacterium]
MAKVILYSKNPCPYCVHAKRLLDEKGVKYDFIDLTDQPETLQKIKNETGWRTVPIIMIDGQLIGGYSDMKALDEEG